MLCFCGDGLQVNVHSFCFKLTAVVYVKEPQEPHPERTGEPLLAHEGITLASRGSGAVVSPQRAVFSLQTKS